MKWLSINRSGPMVISMNDLFLSISTGLFLILHYNYFMPLVLSEDNANSLYSTLYSLLFLCVTNTILYAILAYFSARKGRREHIEKRQIPVKKLIYSAAIKISAYLCILYLIVAINSITFSLTLFITVLFIFSLQYGSQNHHIIKILWKGRSYGSNKVKIIIICLLVLSSILMQPLELAFIFQLHFQIFIILASSLMIFAYYYLQKLIATLAYKDAIPKLLWQVGSLQCIAIVLLILYYVAMEEGGLSFSDQLDYISDNALTLVGMMMLNWLYELVMIESIKKVALNRLIITQVTGLLWFNIYYMAKTEIGLQHYISVIIMLFVLLVNIQLFSEQNIKKVLNLFSVSKKKKSKFTEMEMKESQNDH